MSRRRALLPSGYTFLEWIESTGTQYIVTNILNTGFDYFDATIEKTAAVYNCVLFSTNISDSGYASAREIYLQNGDSSDGMGNMIANLFWLRWNLSVGVQYRLYGDFRKGKQQIFKNGTIIQNSTIGYEESENPYPLFLMAQNRKGVAVGGYTKAKWYSVKFSLSNILVADFVPCISPDNEVGFYDTVSKTFFGNSGTGSFVAGDPV